MALVGPGTQQQVAEDVKPLLEGATEYEYITILNPLTDDFAVRVAQDIPINLPLNIRSKTGLIQSENDVIRSYGLDLKNPDFKGRKHVFSDVVIRAGHTINLKGNEAQVAVRQLVNEILQREGSSRLMADPNLRLGVEQRIVQGRGSVQELMDRSLQSTQSQVNEAISRSNEVEDEFPELKQPTSGNAQRRSEMGTDSSNAQKRSPGRPKKT